MGLHEHLHQHVRAALDEHGHEHLRVRLERRGLSERDRSEQRARRGGHGGPSGRGRGGPGPGHFHGSGPEQVSAADVTGWLTGRLPDGWLIGPPQVTVDRDEIIIVGPLAAPEVPAGSPDTPEDTAASVAAAEAGRITRFREETREERIRIAREAEHRYGRKVAWGATAGKTTELFTTMSVPVMTRLRQPERSVLDTLVDAGVARSRSDALAWCVRLVGEHTEDWLASLREAMTAVERVRADGPRL